MTTTLSAKKAQKTTIFVIENNQVVETTMYDHVCESAEETTSPRGVMRKLFIKERSGIIYKHPETSAIIDELEYVDLDAEDQAQYEYEGETTIRWELRKWQANGRSVVVESYKTEEEANDEWYTYTYNYDYLPDDQRDTQYWNNREEAEAVVEERLNEQ
jgi:hypothetical protein